MTLLGAAREGLYRIGLPSYAREQSLKLYMRLVRPVGVVAT